MSLDRDLEKSVFSQATSFISKNFRVVLGMALISDAPFYLAKPLFSENTGPMTLIAMLLTALSFVLSVVTGSVIVAAVLEAHGDGRADFGRAWGRVKSRFGALLWAVAGFAAFVGAGGLCFIIPGLFLLGYLVLYRAVLLAVEDPRHLNPFVASAKLVEGRFWKVLGAFVVLMVGTGVPALLGLVLPDNSFITVLGAGVETIAGVYWNTFEGVIFLIGARKIRATGRTIEDVFAESRYSMGTRGRAKLWLERGFVVLFLLMAGAYLLTEFLKTPAGTALRLWVRSAA